MSGTFQEIVLATSDSDARRAISGLFNTIIASSLPSSPLARTESIAGSADRSLRIAAQRDALATAIDDALAQLLDAMNQSPGEVAGFTLDGLLSASDACSIWGRLWLASPEAFLPLELVESATAQRDRETRIDVTLRYDENVEHEHHR